MNPKPTLLLLLFANISFAQPAERVSAYENLNRGIELFNEAKFDSAAIYLKRAIEPGSELVGARGDTIMRLGNTYLMHACMELGQNDSVATYGHRVISIAREMRDSIATAHAWYFTGRAYASMGRTDYAEECYESARTLGETIGDYHVTYSTYLALAGIYFKLGDNPKALIFLERAMKLAKSEKNSTDLAYVISMLGETYAKMGMYDEAIESFRQAMKTYEDLGNQRLYYSVQSSLLAALSNSGRHDEAFASIAAPDRYDDSIAIHEPFVRAGSILDLEMQKLMSDTEAKDNRYKFNVLEREYLERQARNLRLSIWLISALVAMVMILLLVLYNRQRQKAKAEAAARYAQEKENEYILLQQESEMRMIRRYIDGLESERSRISRELHDGICNDLLAVEIRMKNGGGDANGQAVLLQNARENIRNVSHELMPPAFQYASIDEILSDYVAHLKVPDKISVKYTQSEGVDWKIVPQKTAFEIYRITQEAVGNSVKHSGADEIGISLTEEESVVVLEIRDNGTGFEKTDRSRGAGLRIIRERVNSIGGVLNIDTRSGGTIITVHFGLS